MKSFLIIVPVLMTVEAFGGGSAADHLKAIRTNCPSSFTAQEAVKDREKTCDCVVKNIEAMVADEKADHKLKVLELLANFYSGRKDIQDEVDQLEGGYVYLERDDDIRTECGKDPSWKITFKDIDKPAEKK